MCGKVRKELVVISGSCEEWKHRYFSVYWSLSIHPSVCVHASICPSIHLSVYMPQSVHPSVCLCTCLNLSIHSSVCLSGSLSGSLSICPSDCLLSLLKLVYLYHVCLYLNLSILSCLSLPESVHPSVQSKYLPVCL